MADEPFQRVRRFFSELRRRNVYQVAVTYAVVGFVLIQVADLTFVRLGLPSWSVTLVIVLVAMGLPLAIVLAWAFERTPEGMRRTSEPESVEQEPTEAEGGVRTGYKVLVGLGLIGAAVAGGWYLTGGGGTSISDRSVAVLPFETLGDTSQTTFTEGLHNDLLTRLQRISEFTVIARPSVMRYEGTDKPLEQVAEELNARWIVTAAVQTAGDQVQVNPRLIDPRSGTERWSDSYRRERSADELFSLQQEITRRIAGALETELATVERNRVDEQPTGDLAAYQLYVRGRRELARRAEGDMSEAVQYFRRAIERDSSFALAWSGLADAAGTGWWGYDGYDTLGISPGDAARRALKLDPELAEAHASMGFLHFRQRNGPAALKELKRAVELKPSYAEAHNWLGLVYSVLGRQDLALTHLELAKELNPQHLLARHHLYDMYIGMGRAEEALAEIREQQRRYPSNVGPYVAETRALYTLGRFEEARAVAREHLLPRADQYPTYYAFLAAIETALGDTARAREWFVRLRQSDPSRLGLDPLALAYAHAAFGDADATLDAFERVKDWGLILTGVLRSSSFPEGMTRIRDDPRYDSLVREANRYWGLNPDGSLPDSVNVSFGTEPSD